MFDVKKAENKRDELLREKFCGINIKI